MSTTPHPLAQLSAYVDGALAPGERAAVDSHLASCADCRGRIAELRAVARLIAAAPGPVPSRRLAPRIATVPAWLAPLRTLSTIASGLAVFLFIASALLSNITFLAGNGTTTAASHVPAAAPAAGEAGSAASGSTTFRNAAGTPVPAAAQDSAQKVLTSASPTPSPTPQFTVSTSSVGQGEVERRPALGDPWLWLVIAVVTGMFAFVLQRRLRTI